MTNYGIEDAGLYNELRRDSNKNELYNWKILTDGIELIEV